MENTIEICRFELKYWWCIFNALQICLFSLMIATFCIESWVKTDYDISIYNTLNDSFYGKFEGSLNRCIKGCDYSFSTGKEFWCNELEINDNESKSLCLMFTDIEWGSTNFYGFEIGSMITIFAWFVLMRLYLKGSRFFIAAFLCSILSCSFHYLGTFLWLGYTKSNFNSDCSNFPKDGTKPNICASQGPVMAMVVVAIFTISIVLYFVIGCMGYCKLRVFYEFQEIERVHRILMIIRQHQNQTRSLNPSEPIPCADIPENHDAPVIILPADEPNANAILRDLEK